MAAALTALLTARQTSRVTNRDHRIVTFYSPAGAAGMPLTVRRSALLPNPPRAVLLTAHADHGAGLCPAPFIASNEGRPLAWSFSSFARGGCHSAPELNGQRAALINRWLCV